MIKIKYSIGILYHCKTSLRIVDDYDKLICFLFILSSILPIKNFYKNLKTRAIKVLKIIQQLNLIIKNKLPQKIYRYCEYCHIEKKPERAE